MEGTVERRYGELDGDRWCGGVVCRWKQTKLRNRVKDEPRYLIEKRVLTSSHRNMLSIFYFARMYIQSPPFPYHPMTSSPVTGIGWGKYKYKGLSMS